MAQADTKRIRAAVDLVRSECACELFIWASYAQSKYNDVFFSQGNDSQGYVRSHFNSRYGRINEAVENTLSHLGVVLALKRIQRSVVTTFGPLSKSFHSLSEEIVPVNKPGFIRSMFGKSIVHEKQQVKKTTIEPVSVSELTTHGADVAAWFLLIEMSDDGTLSDGTGRPLNPIKFFFVGKKESIQWLFKEFCFDAPQEILPFLKELFKPFPKSSNVLSHIETPVEFYSASSSIFNEHKPQDGSVLTVSSLEFLERLGFRNTSRNLPKL